MGSRLIYLPIPVDMSMTRKRLLWIPCLASTRMFPCPGVRGAFPALPRALISRHGNGSKWSQMVPIPDIRSAASHSSLGVVMYLIGPEGIRFQTSKLPHPVHPDNFPCYCSGNNDISRVLKQQL